MPSRPSFRPRKLEEVNATYAAFLAGGFPVDFEGNAETLQCGDGDQTKWLIFLGACEEAIAAGFGDQPIPIPIRCTSNNSYVVTFSEAGQIVRDMRAWGFLAQANCWRLKDEVAAAETGEALNAVDLTEGWP